MRATRERNRPAERRPDAGAAPRGLRPAAPSRFTPLALGLGSSLLTLLAAQAAPPLQYRLSVGDRLVYERNATISAVAGGSASSQSHDQIQVWCLQRQGDESLILLERTGITDGRPQPAQAVVLSIDDGGRRRWPAEALTRLAPLEPALDLLPTLPLGTQKPEEWRTPADPYQQRWRCAVKARDTRHPGWTHVDFAVEEPLGVADVLGQTRSGRYWFDAAAGLVARFECEEEDRASQTCMQIVATFRERARHDPEWCARRADEALHYLRVLNHEDRLLQEVVTRPDDLPRTLQQLNRLWSAFKSDIEARAGSPFLDLADGRQEDLQRAVSVLEARAALGSRWLHQRALPWTLQDPAGKTVTGEAARQGVVIEGFWSSESVWSLRALQSLRELQAELGPRRVRVLAYNLDREVEHARAVIQRCGGGLTQMLGRPLLAVENLPELPVVRVLDRSGVVRGVWIGWQPTYSAARDLALELASRGGQPSR